MATAKTDPTPIALEVLTRKQIKTNCKSEMIESIRESLLSAIRYRDEDNLDEYIETIYQKEEVPDDIPVNDKTKRKIKKDISRIMRRAEKANLQYRVLTINMDSPTDGVAKPRRDLTTAILQKSHSDVVFCQERPGHFEKDIIPKLNRDNQQFDYQWTGNEAGIVWNTNKFDGDTRGFKPSDARMIKIRDKLKENGEQVDTLLSRTCFVKLTPTVPGRRRGEVECIPEWSFIVVSYHGERKQNEVARTKMFNSLIAFVRKLCEEEGNIPFLIGGDFNFDTLKYLYTFVDAAQYAESNRLSKEAQGKIHFKDNFFWEKLNAFTMASAKPLVFNRAEGCELGTAILKAFEDFKHHVKVEDLLDHDPIVATLKWRDQGLDQHVESLTETLGSFNI